MSLVQGLGTDLDHWLGLNLNWINQNVSWNQNLLLLYPNSFLLSLHRFYFNFYFYLHVDRITGGSSNESNGRSKYYIELEVFLILLTQNQKSTNNILMDLLFCIPPHFTL